MSDVYLSIQFLNEIYIFYISFLSIIMPIMTKTPTMTVKQDMMFSCESCFSDSSPIFMVLQSWSSAAIMTFYLFSTIKYFKPLYDSLNGNAVKSPVDLGFCTGTDKMALLLY